MVNIFLKLKQIFCRHSYKRSTPLKLYDGNFGTKWGFACDKCGYVATQFIPSGYYAGESLKSGEHNTAFGTAPPDHDRQLICHFPDPENNNCFFGTYDQLIKRLQELGISLEDARKHGIPI